jgi:hypothetical protein
LLRGYTVLGKYDGFPSVIQARATVAHRIPLRSLQSIIVDALGKLTFEKNSVMLSASSRIGMVAGTVEYEVGVADGVYFNFLDSSEIEKLKKHLKEKSFEKLDLLLRITYHYTKPGGGEIPLRSDAQFVRFNFEDEESVAILVHHFKGIKRIPLEELIIKLIDKINIEAKRLGFSPIQIIEIKGH